MPAKSVYAACAHSSERQARSVSGELVSAKLAGMAGSYPRGGGANGR